MVDAGGMDDGWYVSRIADRYVTYIIFVCYCFIDM